MKNGKRKIRQDLPETLDDAIKLYGLDYVLEHYRQALEQIN